MATPAQVSRDFHYILERIRETTAFGFHQTESFCPSDCFSRVSFRIDSHLFKDREESYRVALPFEDLFDFDGISTR